MSEYEEVRRNPWPLRLFIALAFFAVAGGSALKMGMFKHRDTPTEITAKDTYAMWQGKLNRVLAVKKDIARLTIERKILTASHGGTDPSTWSAVEKAKLEKKDEAIIAKTALYIAEAKAWNNDLAIDNPFPTPASLPSGLPEEPKVLKELPLIP